MGTKQTSFLIMVGEHSDRTLPLSHERPFMIVLPVGYILNMRSERKKDGGIKYQIQPILANPVELQSKPEHISHPISRVLQKLFRRSV